MAIKYVIRRIVDKKPEYLRDITDGWTLMLDFAKQFHIEYQAHRYKANTPKMADCDVIPIIVIPGEDYKDQISMRNECSICREKLDTKIINNVRRVEPCQRGCRG